MIIIEGIDRVGKTTLANKISEELGIKILNDPYMQYSYLSFNEELIASEKVKESHNDIEINIERMNAFLNYYEQFGNKQQQFIVDRFHVSELVYGWCDRGYLALEPFEKIDRRLMNLDTIIMYVEPTNLQWSSKQHGKDLYAHHRMFEVIMETNVKCAVIKCNYNTLNEAVCKVHNVVTALNILTRMEESI